MLQQEVFLILPFFIKIINANIDDKLVISNIIRIVIKFDVNLNKVLIQVKLATNNKLIINTLCHKQNLNIFEREYNKIPVMIELENG
jgi:hypothetical protein